MSAKIIDGRKTKDKVLQELSENIKKLSRKPFLAVVLVGKDPASEIYVREKEKASAVIGVDIEVRREDDSITQEKLEEIVAGLNNDPKVTGIVLQKPLPAQIDDDLIDKLVVPSKDVDGLNPASGFYPTTATGVIKLLDENTIDVSGKEAVVVGRSKLSGLPTALALLDNDATVTICHSKTKNLRQQTLRADILVVSAGVPKLVKVDMVKKGSVVIDVGTNRDEKTGKLVGDVDFGNVKEIASAITPVPGGVGPMIVAGLMMNAVEAVENL